MNMSKVRPGDIVMIDKRGRRFVAEVIAMGTREVDIEPIDSRINYFHAKSTEVIEVIERGPLWKRQPYKHKTKET
jgi:hypothetical protein